MLYEILKSINNFFVVQAQKGTWSITEGTIDLSFLLEGQYFLITGSVLNDGVYQYPCFELNDETFTGTISALAVPKEVVQIAGEAQAFVESDAGKPSAYTSESFGGYTYQRATGSSGAAVTWKEVFASRLRPWRCL